VEGRQELNASIQEALRYVPMVGSLVAVAARLDPAALVGAGRVVGVVDHWAARVGFELPVDDHGASNHDGHARRKGQVVVDLDYNTLAEVDTEALVGAVRAVTVRKQDNDQALNSHLRRAPVVQGGDEALVVRPDGVAAPEHCRENAADQHQFAGCWPPR
jgi:Mn-containing catalase